jgi:transposase
MVPSSPASRPSPSGGLRPALTPAAAGAEQHQPGSGRKEDQQDKIRPTEVSTVSGDCRIATCSINNDTSGYAQLLAWILEHAPGPRIALSIEGTRSYGIGLARAATAAGLLVLECEQPHRKARRGKGKSDPIDAHLAVLTALRLDASQLPIPRADGDREALRILLSARHELTVTSTAQINRLRALLRDAHADTDRQLARAALTDATLTRLARRRLSRDASREQAIHQAEIRRLALAIHDARQALKSNRAQLQSMVDDLAPGLTQRPGIGPVTAAQAIAAFSHPGRCRNDAAFASLAGTCPIPAGPFPIL